MARSDPRQLDLFARSNLIAFPLDRQAALVREITSELLKLPKLGDRDQHWRRRIQQLRVELRALGTADAEITHQILALRTAVACEARRRIHLAILRGEIAL